MSTQAYLVIAHGSRRQEANDHLLAICDNLRASLGDTKVEAAFLELAAPDIPTALNRLLTENISEIIILPFFLSRGIHWHEDIPEIVTETLSSIEHAPEWKLLDPVGMHPQMNTLILEIVQNS